MNLDVQMLIAEMPTDNWQLVPFRTKLLLNRKRIRRFVGNCQCPISSLNDSSMERLVYIIEDRRIRLSVANDIIAAADDRCINEEQKEIRTELLKRFGLLVGGC